MARVHRYGLFALAIGLTMALPPPGDAKSVRPRPVNAYPECGTILDQCVPACDWNVPGGGWPLAACYNNVCYRQTSACEASRIPRPGGGRR
jgi:hypothetical protein